MRPHRAQTPARACLGSSQKRDSPQVGCANAPSRQIVAEVAEGYSCGILACPIGGWWTGLAPVLGDDSHLAGETDAWARTVGQPLCKSCHLNKTGRCGEDLEHVQPALWWRASQVYQTSGRSHGQTSAPSRGQARPTGSEQGTVAERLGSQSISAPIR